MSTRSYITVKVEDKFKTIYCHWDGYRSHNGVLLKEHYNSQELAEKLVELGDLSSLDKSIECPEGHCFDNKIKGYSVFYGRDRGERGVDADINTIFPKDYDSEFHYYWNGEKWSCNNEDL